MKNLIAAANDNIERDRHRIHPAGLSVWGRRGPGSPGSSGRVPRVQKERAAGWRGARHDDRRHGLRWHRLGDECPRLPHLRQPDVGLIGMRTTSLAAAAIAALGMAWWYAPPAYAVPDPCAQLARVPATVANGSYQICENSFQQGMAQIGQQPQQQAAAQPPPAAEPPPAVTTGGPNVTPGLPLPPPIPPAEPATPLVAPTPPANALPGATPPAEPVAPTPPSNGIPLVNPTCYFLSPTCHPTPAAPADVAPTPPVQPVADVAPVTPPAAAAARPAEPPTAPAPPNLPIGITPAMVESCANPNYAIQAECYLNEMPNGGPGGTSPPASPAAPAAAPEATPPGSPNVDPNAAPLPLGAPGDPNVPLPGGLIPPAPSDLQNALLNGAMNAPPIDPNAPQVADNGANDASPVPADPYARCKGLPGSGTSGPAADCLAAVHDSNAVPARDGQQVGNTWYNATCPSGLPGGCWTIGGNQVVDDPRPAPPVDPNAPPPARPAAGCPTGMVTTPTGGCGSPVNVGPQGPCQDGPPVTPNGTPLGTCDRKPAGDTSAPAAGSTFAIGQQVDECPPSFQCAVRNGINMIMGRK